jgi:hypothetical protein
MKSAKKYDKVLGLAPSYTPAGLVACLNDNRSRFNDTSRAIVELIQTANAGRASGEINEELTKKINLFQLRPSLEWNPMSVAGWSVIWNMSWRGEFGEFSNDDVTLLTCLFEAGAHGELRKFRRCGWKACSRWFFQKRDDQLFCAGECKEKSRRASPEYQESQRRTMRTRYRIKKAKDMGLSLAAYDRFMLKRAKARQAEVTKAARKREKGVSR